jgi:class 3 adenylate cyclase
MSQTRALTILFADVADSSRLFETRGDAEARRLIAAVLNTLANVCVQNGGRVIKMAGGDDIMCAFPDAASGVNGGVQMHRRISENMEFRNNNIGLRIGLNYGEVIEEDDGDVFGDVVNVAARIAGKQYAKRDAVMTTRATIDAIAGPKPDARPAGSHWLEGKSEPIELVDVVWQEDTSGRTGVFMAIGSGMTLPTPAKPKLKLNFRGRVIEMEEPCEPVRFVREPPPMVSDLSNYIIVNEGWVSRSHALLECKRGRFILSDTSTNATYVRFGVEGEQRLHRELIHLRNSGTISLGQSTAVNQNDLIHFECS